MKRAAFHRTLAVLLGVLPVSAQACTVCMGGNDRTGEAMNGAIFFMLGSIGSVLACLVAFGVCLIRRANAVPPAGGQSDTLNS